MGQARAGIVLSMLIVALVMTAFGLLWWSRQERMLQLAEQPQLLTAEPEGTVGDTEPPPVDALDELPADQPPPAAVPAWTLPRKPVRRIGN
jgi:hypothetical protein